MNEIAVRLKRDLGTSLDVIGRMDWEGLKDVLEALKLDDNYKAIFAFKHLVEGLDSLDLSQLQGDIITNFHNRYGNVHSAFANLNDELTLSALPSHLIDEAIIKRIVDSYGRALEEILPYYRNISSYFKFINGTADEDIYMKGEKTLKDLKVLSESKIAGLDKWTEDVKSDYAKLFVAKKYGKEFETEASTFKKSSANWLAGTMMSLCLTIVVAIIFLATLPDTDDYQKVWFSAVPKIIIVSVLFYFTNLCLKSYRSQKHNEILNRHRHMALETFEIFQKASTDEATKNAVLMEVTRTIFGTQQTGYTSGNDSDGDSLPTKVIEIIRDGKSVK